MIPKVIHYCWFGRKRKPKLVRDCIKSWKKHLPDYKIIEWNEKNSDLSHPFVKKAYKLKKWAFVADYIRLQKLHEFGGIYLDTDMMILKNLDDLLVNECFFGEEETGLIGACIIGTELKNNFIHECLLHYDSIDFNFDDNISAILIPVILTVKFNSFLDTDSIILNNIQIYSTKYFYPFPFKDKYDILRYKKYITKDSYSIHLWAGSWLEYNEFECLRNGEYKKGIDKVWDNFKFGNVDLKYCRKILSSIKQSINRC